MLSIQFEHAPSAYSDNKNKKARKNRACGLIWNSSEHALAVFLKRLQADIKSAQWRKVKQVEGWRQTRMELVS